MQGTYQRVTPTNFKKGNIPFKAKDTGVVLMSKKKKYEDDDDEYEDSGDEDMDYN